MVFIFGHPVEHSLSPLFQNAAFRKLNLPYFYVPLDVEPSRIQGAIEILRCENAEGANVTVPLKTLVLRYLDRVDPIAKGLNSVNTLYKRQGKLYGTSTDGEGFLLSLGSWRNKLKGSRGMMVGAGGAARAVGFALARSGIRSLKIANWDVTETKGFFNMLRKNFPRLEMACMSLREGEKALADCEWIVQATSLGLKPGDPSPLSLQKAPRTSWVVDLIYHHPTRFLNEARTRKMPYKNGLGMLLHQGALSFGLWTGEKAPLDHMKRALLRYLV